MEKQLEEILIQLFKTNPGFTDSQLLSLARIARNKAVLQSVPEYKSLEIADKQKIGREYQENRRRAKREVLRDESTV